jgi:HAE1 family hydrophobic/amphiphilic exporter-1
MRARHTVSGLVFLALVGVASGALAQTPPLPPPGAPAQMPVIERYAVGQARPPVPEGTEIVELTLEMAYALALEKNLNLKVQRMNPILQDYTYQGMRAQYRPNLSASYSYRNNLTPSNSTLDGVTSVTSIGQTYNTGISQSIRWYGSPSVSASFGNSRSSTNNVTARLNPSFNSSLSFSFSMQLLNNFKIDSNRNAFRTFPIQREITDLQLINQIENTKNSVRNAYWNLRFAIEQIEIARRSLEIARKQWADSLIRVEIGTAAPIDTVQFETAVAQNEQSYLAAQISWRTSELNFKRLLVSGTDDELYGKTINPTDRPELSVQTVDIQAAVTRALAERSDVVISRKNLQISRYGLDLTQGALKPNLSVNAGYNVSGQGGTERVGNTVIPGGYGDALRVLGSFQNPQWNMGFNFSYPLGQLSQKANFARAQIQLDQAAAQLKAQELDLATQVINAGLNVENTYQLYLASVKSREAAEKQADAAQVRFDNGLLTNFEVVTTLNQLTSSRLSELQRIIAYMNALAEFDRVQRIGG